MRSSTPRSDSAPEPVHHVPGLVCATTDNKQYERHPDVDAEIRRILGLPEADWAAAAKSLKSETLVFLIRKIGNSSSGLVGALMYELSTRAVRTSKRWAQGFDEGTTEEIVSEVNTKIVELVLAETSSRQSEFLEVAFGKAVQRHTLKSVEKRNRLPLAHLMRPALLGDDEVELERPEEEIADEHPGPEDLVTEQQAKALIKRACAAVKDRRHIEAVVLRHVYNWPLTDKDPTKPSLARRYGKSEKQIRNWINDALSTMRAAIGDQI